MCKRSSKGSPDRLEVPSVGWLLRGLAALSAMGICAAGMRCNAYASMTTRPLLVQVVSYGIAVQKGSAMLQGRCACCVLTWQWLQSLAESTAACDEMMKSLALSLLIEVSASRSPPCLHLTRYGTSEIPDLLDTQPQSVRRCLSTHPLSGWKRRNAACWRCNRPQHIWSSA